MVWATTALESQTGPLQPYNKLRCHCRQCCHRGIPYKCVSQLAIKYHISSPEQPHLRKKKTLVTLQTGQGSWKIKILIMHILYDIQSRYHSLHCPYINWRSHGLDRHRQLPQSSGGVSVSGCHFLVSCPLMWLAICSSSHHPEPLHSCPFIS